MKRGRPPGPSQKTLVAVEWFREHGGSLRACAQQFAVDAGTLRRALGTLYPFMTLPRPGAPSDRRRRKPDGRVPRAAAKMYLEAGGTLSMREVGDKFSISKQEVSKAVQREKRSRRWKALGATKQTLKPSAIDAAIMSIDRLTARVEQDAWETLIAVLAPILLATPELLRQAVRGAAKAGHAVQILAICRDYEDQATALSG